MNAFGGGIFELVYNSISKLGFSYDEEYFKYAMKECCFF
jgi:hypothetical protein